jgi:hypothetical protein
MIRQLPADAIPVRQVEERPREPYRLFVLTSLALAGLAGFVLGIHIPVERLLGIGRADRTADMVQAHGQVQLLGFAGLFVIGMSLRLVPRFASSRLRFEGLIVPVWALALLSLALRVFVMVWLPPAWHSAVGIAVWFGLLLAASGYLLIVWGTITIDKDRVDGSSWFFLAGSGFYFLQAAFGTAVALHEAPERAKTFPYLADMGLLYLQLAGFLISYIGGVATRALPTMSGIPRPERGAARAALALTLSVLLLWAPLGWAAFRGGAAALYVLSDAGLMATGGCFLVIAWFSGALRRAAERLRPASQPHMRLVKMAFAWLTLAGLMAVYLGGKGAVAGELPSVLDLDALRHTLAAGVVTTLILGMGMMILPEMAAERQRPHHQASLSAFLAALMGSATVLRVLPGLAGAGLNADARNGMTALAGVLAEVAVVTFGVKLALLMRGRAQPLAARPTPPAPWRPASPPVPPDQG